VLKGGGSNLVFEVFLLCTAMRRKYWKVEGNIQEEGMKKKAWLRKKGFENHCWK
jgi:hypothetical protein